MWTLGALASEPPELPSVDLALVGLSQNEEVKAFTVKAFTVKAFTVKAFMVEAFTRARMHGGAPLGRSLGRGTWDVHRDCAIRPMRQALPTAILISERDEEGGLIKGELIKDER
jgi:hypothetical protein